MKFNIAIYTVLILLQKALQNRFYAKKVDEKGVQFVAARLS